MPQLRGRHALSVFDVDYVDEAFIATSGDGNLDAKFDPSQYSEFKYGRRDIARMYATGIFVALIRHQWAMADYSEPFVITGTPYKRVPNAARVLAMETYSLIRKRDERASYASIYQPRLAVGDYGTLSQDQRNSRNQSKKRYFDPQDFEGKHVILIDDVRITGSIEKSTVAMLEDIDTLSITTLNLVRLNPEVALERPDLEDRLNHYSVDGLDALWMLMVIPHDNFVWTTRAIKYILQSDEQEVKTFLKRLNSRRLHELYQGVVDEGYDQMAAYRHNFEHILTALKDSR